jgi:phage terminase large subunit GpA-like protein
LGVDAGLKAAFDSFRERCVQGWAKQNGVLIPVMQCFVDSSWYSDTVYAWCRAVREEGRDRFRPAKGYGMLQRRDKFYREPDRKGKGSAVQFVGRGYHLSRIAAQQVALVHINADTWKSTVRERFALEDPEQPGACVLFHAEPHEHLEFAEHLLSEEPREVYDPDRGGKVIVWRRVSRNNHYLDAMALAMVAGDYVNAQQETESPAVIALPGQESTYTEWRSKAVRR